ncbi:DUF1885 family protein [Bacillus sp. 165]|uniref:DUF1885 family protein n=1 Tax=Bacillus sp. 165 TaxID=1529117 RepID=UPI001ADC569C|nr:DUF1885 family protein [Bacillus sp. 165]MBO9130324.1 DUF1885 family protein [Bacillus sp. 165]
MNQDAFIKLVPNSAKQTITLQDVKTLFSYYKEITFQTGQQLGWNYGDSAFPYKMIDTSESTLQLKSDHDRYHTIFVGVGTEQAKEEEQHFIQITLPATATFGDKGKANELCRFLAKKLNGELHLFNGRIMYFYKR